MADWIKAEGKRMFNQKKIFYFLYLPLGAPPLSLPPADTNILFLQLDPSSFTLK